jgi:hypothetical protein
MSASIALAAVNNPRSPFSLIAVDVVVGAPLTPRLKCHIITMPSPTRVDVALSHLLCCDAVPFRYIKSTTYY